MAYTPTQDDEERRRQEAMLSAAPGAPMTSSAAPAAGGAATPQPAPSGPAGTGFINLQRYLGLNQAGGQQMANQLASDVDAKTTQARQAIDAASSDFAAKTQAGTLQGPSATPGNNPAELKAAIEDARNKSQIAYSGPNGFDATGLTSQVNAFSGQAGGLGTGAGRAVLLGDKYGGTGNYNQGARNLDSFLSGAAGGQRLKQSQEGYGKLRDYLGLTQNNAAAQANSAAADSKTAAGAYGQQADAWQAQLDALNAAQQKQRPRVPQGRTYDPRYPRRMQQ